MTSSLRNSTSGLAFPTAQPKAPAKTLQIVVEDDGTLRFLHDDELSELLGEGEVSMQRASHVEPDAFGMWIADLSPSGGPALGPYLLRGDALEAEAHWLRENRL